MDITKPVSYIEEKGSDLEKARIASPSPSRNSKTRTVASHTIAMACYQQSIDE